MSVTTSDRTIHAEQADDKAGIVVERLCELVDSGSQKAFADAVESIDWRSQSPTTFREAINLALEIGCHAIAAQLASRGHALFSDDPTLVRIARVLAPPKGVRKGIPAVPGINASMEWLEDHRERYSGKWVAVRNGELLASSDSRKEISGALDDLDTRSDVLVAKV